MVLPLSQMPDPVNYTAVCVREPPSSGHWPFLPVFFSVLQKKNSHIFSDHCDSGIFDQTAFPVSLKDLFSPVWKFFLIVRAPEQYIPVFCTHGNSLYIRLKHHLLCIIFRCTQSICQVYGIDGSQKSSVSSPNPFAIF